MTGEWLTTGEAAEILGCSRQHVVDLCDRGELEFTRLGTHRRIRRGHLPPRPNRGLTREQEKSLWLHGAVLGHLMLDPEGTLTTARDNISRWRRQHRPDGMAAAYLGQWEDVVDQGVDAVAEVLTSRDQRSCELRQNTPFAGVLPEPERLRALRSFSAHWETAHAPGARSQ